MKQPAPLLSPQELGFPEKFGSWYADQIVAIDKTILNPLRFTALAMPTGSGKSVTGIASALLHPKVKRACYLTSTKGLQDQLDADFACMGLHDVRGQRNYSCRALQPGEVLSHYRRGRSEPTCDDGPCHAGVPCNYAPIRADRAARPDCLYYGAVYDSRQAELVSTNYAMWLTAGAYSEGLGDFDLLILDEAHDADKELESFLAVDITLDDVHYIGSKFLKTDDVSTWKDWAIFHKEALRLRIELRELQPPNDPEGVRDLRAMKQIFGKLNRVAGVAPQDWILDTDQLRARFAPIKVSAYAEEFLFRKVPHVLLMSATMTRKTTQLLGIDPNQLNFWECPSRFAIKNRPIIVVNTHPSVRVDARMSDDAKFMWMRRIDRLIEPRIERGWKGIIHTVSYQRVKELLARSEYKDWMMVHDSANTREIIQKFKQIDAPYILVSPSIVTGYDFPGDQCRYQILGKVPLPDMRGPIMEIRGQIDKEYSGYLAMQKLVQACGRPVRGPNDWAETFIVDDHFSDWFLKRYYKHAPRWFLDAIEYVECFPEPRDEEAA